MRAEVTSVFFSYLSVGRDLAASNLKIWTLQAIETIEEYHTFR